MAQEWWKDAPIVAQPEQAQPSQSGAIYIPPAPEKPKVKEPPSGYRFGPPDATGQPTLVPIPGGPADPSAPKTDKPTEAQGKASVLLARIKGGFSDILETTARAPQSQEPGILESIRGGLSPVGLGGLATRQLADADRRIVHDAQVDILDALLTLGTGAAYNREQLEGQLSSYFPAYGDTQAEIDVKNRRLRRQIEAAKLQVGPLADQLEEAIAPYLGAPTEPPKEEFEATAGPGLSERDLQQKAELEQAYAAGASWEELEAIANKYGNTLPAEQREVIERSRQTGEPLRFEVTPTDEASLLSGVAASPVGAFVVGASNALLSGAMDELAPVLGLDSQRVQLAKELLREKYPVPSFAGEVAGSVVQQAGIGKAFGAAGMAAPGTAAGITAGAAYGAGEAPEGERLAGAGIGAAAALAGEGIGRLLTRPGAREAVEKVAADAGVPVEAVEQVLADVIPDTGRAVDDVAAPLTAEAQEEIGGLARQALGRGRGARRAKQQLAEMAKVNPEAQAAAERLGVELPIDILSDDAQLKTITGLARSQVGSEAESAWSATVRNAATKADEALEALGASPDIAQVGADVSERLTKSIDDLEKQGAALRREVDDAIDIRARVEPSKTRDALNEIIDDLGGIDDAKEALSGEEKKLLAMLGVGDAAKMPTYARLNSLRDDIGRALFKGQGPWADTSQKNLARYYAALADDQLGHIASVGGEELAEKMKGSNTLFKKMFDTRREMQAVFGEKLEKDLAPLITRAVTKAGKGDAQDLRKLLSAVPEDMRGNVLMSGLMAKSTSRSAQGGFSFAEFAKTYRGLRQNAPVYKQFADAIGPQGSQVLTDLYALSRRISEGQSKVIMTGKANQPLINALNAESLVSKVMDGAAKRAAEAGISVATGGIAGRSVAGALSESVQAATGASKSNLDKLHGLLSSEPFRELVEKVGTGQDATRAVNRLSGSREWNSYAARVLGLKTPDQRKQWLQRAIVGASVQGSTRATESPESSIKVIPQ